MHEEELAAEFKVTREALLSFNDLRPLQLDLLTETNYSNSEVPTLGQDEENTIEATVEQEDPQVIELRSEIEILEAEMASLLNMQDQKQLEQLEEDEDDNSIDENKLVFT